MNFGRLRLSATTLRVWLVYALFFVSGIAQAAIVPLLPRLSTQFTLSATETALLLALPGLATLVVSVPAGLAADRFGARRVTLLAGLLLCVSNLAQATPSLALLLAGRVAFGLAYGVVWTTGMAWLSELDSGSGRSLGPAVTGSSVGIMVGPAVGGMLAEFTTLSAAFVAVAGVAAAVVIPLAAVPAGRDRRAARPQTRATRAAQSPQPAGASSGLRTTLDLLRRPGIAAAAGALVVSGSVSGVSNLLVSDGLHRLGISTGQIGLAFSAAAVCYIVVSTTVVRLGRRAHTLRFNAVSTMLLALGLLPAAAGLGVGGLIAALMLSAAPRAAVSTIAYALASTTTAGPAGEPGPDDGAAGDGTGAAGRTTGAAAGRDGLVFGLLNGGWAAAMVLMPLLAGAMEQHDGARAGYLAVILPSCAIGLWLLARSGSRTEAEADAEPGRGPVERLRGAAARTGVGRLIPRPDRSHRIRLVGEWTGRSGVHVTRTKRHGHDKPKASRFRPVRGAERHPVRTLGRRLPRRDDENPLR